jgi:hypothetical protein
MFSVPKQHTMNVPIPDPKSWLPNESLRGTNKLAELPSQKLGLWLHVPTGQIGSFLKEYKPTGRQLTMQIQLQDGRIYFAPSNEFIKI